MRFKEIMTTDLEVVTPTATALDAAKKMRDLDVGVLPVCDGKKGGGTIPSSKPFNHITAMASSITTRLGDIEEQIDAAASQFESDSDASPALEAVFDELHSKTREARDTLKGADEDTIVERVVEVEQSADSAKRAAEADENLHGDTRGRARGSRVALRIEGRIGRLSSWMA